MKPVCPICHNELPSVGNAGAFPFCSARCKKLDLYRWLNEEYRISEPITQENVLDLEGVERVENGEGAN